MLVCRSPLAYPRQVTKLVSIPRRPYSWLSTILYGSSNTPKKQPPTPPTSPTSPTPHNIDSNTHQPTTTAQPKSNKPKARPVAGSLPQTPPRIAPTGPPKQRIITSFTDSLPMIGWEPLHALRELWQNFRDGLAETFRPSKVYFTKNGPDEYIAMCSGRLVGFLDCKQRNRVSFFQKGCKLQVEHLQLASKKKAEDEQIGGHGEGFKLAVCLLLTKGYGVLYRMDNLEWQFKLEKVYGANRNMCVDIFGTDELLGGLEIIITGPGAHNLFDPIIDLGLTLDMELLRDLDCSTRLGSLFLVNTTDRFNKDRLNGGVYCRGLYVNVNDELRQLEISANINTNLGRDRQMLPIQSWQIIEEILADASQQDSAVPIYEHLLMICRNKDLPRVRDYLEDPLRRYLAKKHDIPKQRVIFLHRQTPQKDYDILTSMGNFVYLNMAIRDSISLNDRITKYLSQLPEETSLSPDQQLGLSYLKKFFSCVLRHAHANINIRLKVKDFPDTFFEVSPCYLEPSDIDIMTIHPSMVATERVGSIAMLIFLCYGNHYNIRKDYSVVSEIQGIFARSPSTFEDRQYQLMALQKSVAGSNYNNIQKNFEETASTTTQPIKKSVIGRTIESPLQLDPRIFQRDPGSSFFRGPWGIDPPEDKSSCTCGYISMGDFKNVEFGLVDHRRHPVSLLVENLSGNLEKKLRSQEVFIRWIARVVQRLSIDIEATLGTTFEYSLVYTPQALLGFTVPKRVIFLNVHPLFDARKPEIVTSLFFTLLHELAHRAVVGHNTEFSREFGKLVLKCSGVHSKVLTELSDNIEE